MSDHLALLRTLPDGTIIFEDRDFLDRLHKGAPEIGWVGDDRLYMAHDTVADCLEVWRNCEDGIPRRVMRSKPGVRILDTGALTFLAQHDTRSRRAFNTDEIFAHNRKLEADKAKRWDEQLDDISDRLAWALHKDLGGTKEIHAVRGRAK